MPIEALNSLHIIIAQSTTGGTAPGGTVAPTGCTLSSPSDISPFVTGIQQETMANTLNVTTFGSGGFDAFVAGLRSGTLTLNMLNAYAASELNALIGVNGSVRSVGSPLTMVVEVRRSSAARSATNPGFVCAVLNRNFQTFNASVGEVPTVTWSPQITGGFGELIA